MIKGTINWEDKTILNLYAPSTISLKHIKQNSIDLKGKMDKFMFVVEFKHTLIGN